MSLDVSLILPACDSCGRGEQMVYSDNITGNLSLMADKCGVFAAIWEPDKNGYKYARDIIHVLSVGSMRLKINPEKYKQFNPSNGWGDYEGLDRFVENYREACREYPNALIEVY